MKRLNLRRICLFIGGVLVLIQIGCATTEKFVQISERSIPKTTSLYVTGIATQLVFKIKGNKFIIEQATVPVTIMGAGVFVSPNNHILTVAHLFTLQETTGITVCRDTQECTPGELLYRQENRDLALVRSDFNYSTPYARLADPRKLKVGQEVLAIGNPLGFPFTVTHGIISALHRDFGFNYNMTQSDASIHPGNSGGPLFNLKGEIVGINSCIMSPVPVPVFTGLGFSVQSGQIVEFLTKFRGLDKSMSKFDYGYWNGLLETIRFDSSN